MRIAVISDTHGSLDSFKDALEAIGTFDLILHAGDILYHGPRNPIPKGYSPKELAAAINSLEVPFIAAAGNCDAPIDQNMLTVPIQSPYAFVMADKFRILVTHGHIQLMDDLIELAKKWNIDVLITGHTHKKTLEKADGIMLLNPGSCALPKDEIPSAAVIEDSKIHLVDIKSKEIIKTADVHI